MDTETDLGKLFENKYLNIILVKIICLTEEFLKNINLETIFGTKLKWLLKI